MKIVIDARYLSAETSGIGRYSENLLRALADLHTGHEWHVFVQSGYVPASLLAAAMRFHMVPWKPLSTGTMFQMGRQIDALRGDLVHIHCPVIPIKLKTPLVLSINDWQPLTEPEFSAGRPLPIKLAYDQFYRWAYPRGARRARAIINLSEATRRETIRRLPETHAYNHVVLPGLDEIFRIHPSEHECCQISRELRLPQRYILYVGSTRPNKQIPTLIKAFSTLHSQHPDCHLVLVLKKDRFFSEIAKVISKMGLTAWVLILEGVEDRQLRVIYHRAAALALVSTNEGFGFPVLEAMAQGTPVIIGDEGALPEVAEDAAMRVPVRNPQALATALSEILTNTSLAAGLCKAGPLRAKKFSWERAALQTLAIYDVLNTRFR